MPILKKVIILLLVPAFFFASCTSASSKSEVIPTPSSNIETATTMTLISPSSTSTIIPILPSSTPTILPTIPTLPDEAAYRLLFNMLHAGDTCELPCWLNITPGISSHNDAHLEWGSFLQMAGTTKILPRDYLYLYDYVVENNTISILTHYYLSPDSELIDSIDISTRVLKDVGNGNLEPVYTLTAYKDTLHDYLLPNILSTYGLPAQVLLSMEIITAEPTSPDFFHIWLLYPANGAIIEYTGSAQVNDNIINGCPSDTFVSLWLVSPNDLDMYQKTLKDATGADWSDLTTASPFYKSTTDAIGMTANEFYETYKISTNRCIKSPLNIWPKH